MLPGRDGVTARRSYWTHPVVMVQASCFLRSLPSFGRHLTEHCEQCFPVAQPMLYDGTHAEKDNGWPQRVSQPVAQPTMRPLPSPPRLRGTFLPVLASYRPAKHAVTASLRPDNPCDLHAIPVLPVCPSPASCWDVTVDTDATSSAMSAYI